MLLMPCNAHLWARCPGSVYYLDKPEPDDDIIYEKRRTTAKKGAIAHIVAANAIANHANPFNRVHVRWSIPRDEQQQLMEDARWYKKQILQLTNDEMLGRGVEATVRLESIIHERGAKGKIDYMAYSTDHIMIFDYKYGKVPVKAKGNHQLWLYAAGLVDTKPWWHGSKISVVILQPATRTVDIDTKSASAVRKLARAYEAKADKALAQLEVSPELATYKPLKSVCMYCRGYRACMATINKE